MRLRRLRSHPEFRLEGRSKHFQSFWELELDPGEQTMTHQHYESEELVCLLAGEGTVRVAEVERLVQPGEVILVPPRTDHVITNPTSDRLLRAITVESRFDLGAAEGQVIETADVEPTIRAEEEASRSARTIDDLMEELPGQVDEATAIKSIVELFDIGGNLSEQIENALGLDNERGLEALGQIEKKIMRAVVEITTRYRQKGGRWLQG